MPIIKCDGVTLGYDGTPVIENIGFELDEGRCLCIVGENGAGKTTLIKGLLGLIKPYRGKIEINCEKVGFLPQQTQVQSDFPASVREVVMSGCLAGKHALPFYTKADRRTAELAAEKMGLGDIKRKSFRELSGGQQQRVLLARALCSAGGLLVLDEPAAGLDPIITSELYSLIASLNRNDGLTIVMVSHDIESALKCADRIAHVGKDDFWFGTTEDYLKSDLGRSFVRGANE